MKDWGVDLRGYEPTTLHIVGANGKLGRDLGKIATIANDIEKTSDADNADFVALCTPSHVSKKTLEQGAYEGKTIIDLSGAAKQLGLGQYGLMDGDQPWDPDFDASANIFSNPGCIAGAVICGLGAAGLTGSSLPRSLSIFSVGGQSHTPSVEEDDIKLSRRLGDHPHVSEIEQAFEDKLSVNTFMPTVCDVPHGLLVAIHGSATPRTHLNFGTEQLAVSDVAGTSNLRHRLEVKPSEADTIDFSLAVVIDNLRFVTHNAVELINYLSKPKF